MYIAFDSIPGRSRIWIYQATRAFGAAERGLLLSGLKELCDEWSAHGTPLETSFTIQFDQFVILAVNEQNMGASGCSIDGSVRFLKDLQQKMELDFFDRSQVAFLYDQKITLHPLSQLKTLFQNRTLSADAIAFDNLVNTKADWEKRWRLKVKDSWLAAYLPKTAVAG